MSLGGCSPLLMVLILFWMQSLPMALMALTVSLYPSASRGCRYCRGIKTMTDVVASYIYTAMITMGAYPQARLTVCPKVPTSFWQFRIDQHPCNHKQHT